MHRSEQVRPTFDPADHVFRPRMCRNVRLMVRRPSSWITLDTHNSEWETVGPHDTLPFLADLSPLPPLSSALWPPPYTPILRGGKADSHSASLSKQRMNKRKETSCWQSMSAPPGAKTTVSNYRGLSKMPQRNERLTNKFINKWNLGDWEPKIKITPLKSRVACFETGLPCQVGHGVWRSALCYANTYLHRNMCHPF